MRLPDLSRLRLEPRAGAEGVEEDEDATGAFMGQIYPRYIDCSESRTKSVRTQAWERFQAMAKHNARMLAREEQDDELEREIRRRDGGRDDDERRRDRDRRDRDRRVERDVDDPTYDYEDLEDAPLGRRDTFPARFRQPRAPVERHLQDLQYARSDDGESICMLCSTELAAGFAKDDSEDAKIQLAMWDAEINTEMAYSPYPHLRDARGRPWRLANRDRPRVPVTDPRLRIPVPEEWKDGEACIEITNPPNYPLGNAPNPCTLPGPLICYHKACILIAMKKHYDAAKGYPDNMPPPSPAATNWPAFLLEARAALGREPSFGPPDHPDRIDWLFGPRENGRWNYFRRPRPDEDTTAALVAAADEAAAQRRRAEGRGLGAGYRAAREALNREAPGQVVAPAAAQQSPRERLQLALLLRGPLAPVFRDQPWGQELDISTLRCVRLNEAFPECRLLRALDSQIVPGSGFGTIVYSRRDSARVQRRDMADDDSPFDSSRTLHPHWSYSEQFKWLLDRTNEPRTDLGWKLSTLVNGTRLADRSSTNIDHPSARTADGPDMVACRRAASFRFYLNDVAFAPTSDNAPEPRFGVGALRVTVGFPVKLHTVEFNSDNSAIPSASEAATVDRATRRGGRVVGANGERQDDTAFRGPDFDVYIRPGHMVWADSSDARPDGTAFTTKDTSMFRSDNPAWRNIDDALGPTSRLPRSLAGMTMPGTRYTVYDNHPDDPGGCRSVSTNENMTPEDADTVAEKWLQLNGTEFPDHGPAVAGFEKNAFRTGIKMTIRGVSFENYAATYGSPEWPRGGHHARLNRDVYDYARLCIGRVMQTQSARRICVLDAVAAHLAVNASAPPVDVKMHAWSDPSMTYFSTPGAARGEAAGLSDGRAHASLTVYYVRK